MKRELLLALSFLIIVAAKCNDPSVGEYFKKPVFRDCVALEACGLKACDGIVKPIIPGQIIMEDFDAEDEVSDYHTDKENRLYICLRFPKRCK